MENFEGKIGFLARRLNQIAVAAFHSEVAAIGCDLTPIQYIALEAIGLNRGIDQATLAGIIANDKATTGGVVDRLVGKGLIGRHTNKRDRRAKELRITETGRRTLLDVKPAAEAAELLIVRGLNSGEASDLLLLLSKVVSNGNEISRAPHLKRIADFSEESDQPV